jgi:clan AA aspartic protease
MITGVFNDREARVALVARGPKGQEQGIAAIIDTGFSGHLTLPLAVVEALGLIHLGQGKALIGDGTIQVFDLYEAILIWDDEPVVVDVATAETEPLLGMGLIYGHDLRIQAVEGGPVRIEKLIFM